MRKLLAYFISCMSLAAINYLVISYAFVKNDLIQNFNMDQVDIGIADSMRMIGGVTGLLIFTFNTFIKTNYAVYYSIGGIIYALLFGSIPILYYFDWRTKYAIFIINLLTGFVKAPTFPLMLQIINKKQYYDKNIVQDKWKMIVWAALTSIGSIGALIFSNIIVYSLYFPWTICLFFGSFLVIIFSIIVGIFFYNDDESSVQKEQIYKYSLNSKIQTKFSIKQSMLFLGKFILNLQNFSFVVSYMLIRQIEQVYAMFLPLFLNDSGYESYKGYVSSGFIICNIAGALIFSLFANSLVTSYKLQQKNQFIQNQTAKNNQFKQPKSFQLIRSISICLSAICSILLTIHQLDKQTQGKHDILIYSILISLSGLFLGGPMSQIQTFEMLDVINMNSKSIKFQSQMKQNSKNFKFQQDMEKKEYNEQPKKNNDILLQNERIQNNPLQYDKQIKRNKSQKKESFRAQLILGFINVVNYLMFIPLLIITGKILQLNIQYYFLFIMILSLALCFTDLTRQLFKKLEQKKQNDS